MRLENTGRPARASTMERGRKARVNSLGRATAPARRYAPQHPTSPAPPEGSRVPGCRAAYFFRVLSFVSMPAPSDSSMLKPALASFAKRPEGARSRYFW